MKGAKSRLSGRGRRGASARRRVPCEAIRGLLVEYLGHELGGERAVMVREHIRACPECAAEAARLEKTLALLREAPMPSAPYALSPTSRRRLQRAVAHPVLDWIFVHHRIVAWTVALGMLAAVLALAWHCRLKPETVIYWLR